MAIDDWFLTTAERGNSFTRLSHRRGGRAYSSGNSTRPLAPWSTAPPTSRGCASSSRR
ncbi:hypothetical protein BRM3_07550 [Brachybacterium huguangmaarense]|uniref:Uncharacterized protein n=1 Tax=Brachybacterium huguangmaarense TaxID=1652028 RepID=A0ABY6FX59_9MICO|nr:hypothetical protein [Brachybacterium huguangmaarense]UYG15507.1 hypothetical protein BRM3_07550 [Brachybacterium huguangmaarense]